MLLQAGGDVVLQLLYAAFSLPSSSTETTSSRYAGRASEISSSDTKAQVSIRYLPNSSGDAPGLRRMVTSVLFFLEQALSSTVVRSMVSITPNCWVKRSLPGRAPVVAVLHHALSVDPEQGVVEIIGIAAEKRAGEPGNRFATLPAHLARCPARYRLPVGEFRPQWHSRTIPACTGPCTRPAPCAGSCYGRPAKVASEGSFRSCLLHDLMQAFLVEVPHVEELVIGRDRLVGIGIQHQAEMLSRAALQIECFQK